MTRTKRIDLWQTIVDGIVTDYRRLDNACDAAMKAGAMDVNGPLYEAIWRSVQGMLERIDEDGWINWFIYENDCGKKAMQAKGFGKRGMTPIKTTRHLAILIVESEDHFRENAEVHKSATGGAASTQVEGCSGRPKSDSERVADCGATPCSISSFLGRREDS